MFPVEKRRSWRKPKHLVQLVGAAIGGTATVVAAVIVVAWTISPPPPRHVVNRVALPTPTVNISKIEKVCGRRPEDHTTFVQLAMGEGRCR